ncbi:DUF5666 domain-containing protein [Rhodococcus sp. TAF43]|uniref:DUF5666 domain-containing protein n=1 Tax=unclassified Rhodococcus (in: high G+C Gram-positive bacteria) TaxID=192944 RepID=UPI00158212BB|nr:DUF5666 domain-containing protein [Rhodococcus sp. W8901]QKT13157.1 hypothetical protein HUN07_22675 [Rhodococcus sp. W8901]
MTNPEDPRDPRTPQERAYDPAEQARPSDETVQWARTGDDSTQQIPPVAPDQPTEQYYTADPYQAYGSPPPNATQAYPTYDPRLDPQAPLSNPTQAYPTYYAQGGYPPPGYPPPGQPPTGEVPSIETTPEHKPGRRVGLWAAVGAGAVLLALGLGIGFLLNSGGPDNSTTASAPSIRTSAPTVPGQPRSTAPPTSAPDTTSPLESIPGGVGELIGKAGTAMGTITANDGGTLTVDSIGGTKVTVFTTADTTLISLTANTIADLKPGESVLVQGDKVEGGAVTAKLIIGTTLPNFGN